MVTYLRPLSDVEPRFTCQAREQKGADIRPNFHWEEEARRAKERVTARRTIMCMLLILALVMVWNVLGWR